MDPASLLEDARIAAHLEGAEQMARERDVSHLSPATRTIRAFVLEELRGYRLGGRFPKDGGHAEQRPCFVDASGTRCALAHLLEQVGAQALVARIAATANHARVSQLAEDPEFLSWLLTMGLSLEEAARIQPPFGATEGSRATESGRP